MWRYVNYSIILTFCFLTYVVACWAGKPLATHSVSQCEQLKPLLAERKFKNGPNITVRVERESTKNCRVLKGSNWSSWGESENPASFVTGIKIIVDGKPISVYVSAFSDLGDIRSVDLLQKDDSCILRLKSGGQEPYIADLTILHGKLVGRRVYEPLFYNDSYEQTIYHFTVE